MARGSRIELSGMRERRQKSTERDENTDRMRWTKMEGEIGTDGDAVNSS